MWQTKEHNGVVLLRQRSEWRLIIHNVDAGREALCVQRCIIWWVSYLFIKSPSKLKQTDTNNMPRITSRCQMSAWSQWNKVLCILLDIWYALNLVADALWLRPIGRCSNESSVWVQSYLEQERPQGLKYFVIASGPKIPFAHLWSSGWTTPRSCLRSLLFSVQPKATDKQTQAGPENRGILFDPGHFGYLIHWIYIHFKVFPVDCRIRF